MDNGLDFTRTDYKSGFCIFGFYISLSLSLSLSPFAMGRLKNIKEMELCERIQSLEHLYLTLKM